MCFCCTTAAICILVWNSPTALKFFAYCMWENKNVFFASDDDLLKPLLTDIAGAAYSGQAATFA